MSASARRPAASTSRRRSSTASATTCGVAREEIFGPVLTVIDVRRRGRGAPRRQRLAVRPGGGGLDPRHQQGPPDRPRASAPARSGSTRSTPPITRSRSAGSSSRASGATSRSTRWTATRSSRPPGSTCPEHEHHRPMSEIAERGPTRRRTIGPRGDGERSRLPQQRPWAQPRMRYKPTEVMSADELESIHEASLDVLEEIGMDFLDPEARDVLAAAGAKVEPGTQRVRFDRGDGPRADHDRARRSSRCTRRNPAHDLADRRRLDGVRVGRPARPTRPTSTAAGGSATAPTTRTSSASARCSTSSTSSAGYPVEPIDIHPSIRHLDAIYDILTLADKPLHAYSLGRQRNLDALEMARIAPRHRRGDARPRAVDLHGHQLELAAPARHADAPGHPRPARPATRSSS